MKTKGRCYPSEWSSFYITFLLRVTLMNSPYWIDRWPILESEKQFKTSSFTCKLLPKSPLWSSSLSLSFPLLLERNEFWGTWKIMACFSLTRRSLHFGGTGMIMMGTRWNNSYLGRWLACPLESPNATSWASTKTGCLVTLTVTVSSRNWSSSNSRGALHTASMLRLKM